MELDAEELGEAAAALLNNRTQLGQLKSGCAKSSSTYSIEAMVQRFADGIEDALSTRR